MKETKRPYTKSQLIGFMKDNNITTIKDMQSAIKDLFKDFIQEALEAECEAMIVDSKEDEIPNTKNGFTPKSITSSYGGFDINRPRDRNSFFKPTLVKNYQRNISEIEEKIISMYAKGMSTRDINEHMGDIYGIEMSADMVSTITNKVLPLIRDWQNRPLDDFYPVVFLDAIHYSVREGSTVVKKAAYVVVGITKHGIKEILGIYIGENESSKFWLGVITDLKNRGVKDILIASIDGLAGFKEAINSIFPTTEVQRCVIHQIRNTLNYVSWKDKKEFAKELKGVYQASNEKAGREGLSSLKEKWGSKYHYPIKSWENNWESLSTFYSYTPELRRIMYTTNIVENVHRQFRKATKTKGVFTTDDSLMKMLYLVTKNIERRWTKPISNWPEIIGQLTIRFKDRIEMYLYCLNGPLYTKLPTLPEDLIFLESKRLKLR